MVFQYPFKVNPAYEAWKTPANYRNYPGGKQLPALLKVWRVQNLSPTPGTMPRPSGAVSKPWTAKEAPDSEALVAGYNTGKMSGAVAVGRDRNFLQWGFSAPPSQMTEAGRNFFLNCVCYMSKFESKAPAAK